MLSCYLHCHCERKSERDSMRFLWLQSARWLGFPGGTYNCNFDIPCGSGGRLKCLPQGASDVVTPLAISKYLAEPSAGYDFVCSWELSCPKACPSCGSVQSKMPPHNNLTDPRRISCKYWPKELSRFYETKRAQIPRPKRLLYLIS